MSPVIGYCLVCGTQFSAPPSVPQRFCSKSCARRKPDPAPRACALCGGEFVSRKRTQRYCSRSCSSKVAGMKAGVVRAAQLRGTGEDKAYPKLNGRHAHRVIAEQKLGRPLRPGEIVHHKDDNILNNDPSNLHVFASQADHARYHSLVRWHGREFADAATEF